MIYLILDTNIWIYLANGLDVDKNKYSDDQHFKLLEELDTLQKNGELKIIVNDIIYEEWKRNKHNSELKIEKLNKKKSNIDSTLRDIKHYSKLDTTSIKEAYNSGIDEDIKLNEEHIRKVEEFLHNSCLKVDVPQSVKLEVIELALSKKAPFHNNKNNFADACILFSGMEYFKDFSYGFSDQVFFVSNNHQDFTNAKDNNNFHPDISDVIRQMGVSIGYSRYLPQALSISKEIVKNMEEFYKEMEDDHNQWLETVRFTCKTPYCESKEDFVPWGHLDGEISVKHEERNHPNQMELFPHLPKKQQKETTTPIGECVVCATTHLDCPVCDEFIFVDYYDENSFECSECHSKFEFIHDNSSYGMSLIIKCNNTNAKRAYTI